MLLNIHLNNISSIESTDINFIKDSYKFRSDNILTFLKYKKWKSRIIS